MDVDLFFFKKRLDGFMQYIIGQGNPAGLFDIAHVPVIASDPEEPGEDVAGEPEEVVAEEPVEPEAPFDFLTSAAADIIEALSFMSSPIRRAKVTIYDSNLPNAPRPYRNGYHEGLDYFGSFDTPILSVAKGVVLRVDHGFTEMTLEEYILRFGRGTCTSGRAGLPEKTGRFTPPYLTSSHKKRPS